MKLSDFKTVNFESIENSAGVTRWHAQAYNDPRDLTPKIAVRCMPSKEIARKALEAWAKILP